MPKHARNLLVLATLCWVAPLSAQQRPIVVGGSGLHPSDCPYERARVSAAQAREPAAPPADGSPREGSLFAGSGQARAFFP